MRFFPLLAVLFTSTAAFAAPTAAPPPSTGAAAPTPVSEDALRKGVVQVEQNGRPIAVGTVLSRDGRVITSLGALANVAEPDVRYADGTVVKAKLGHKDKAWDLALLVPQTGRWLDGLMPTDVDPAGVDLRAFLPKNGKLAPSGVAFKGRVDAKSREGDALKSVLDLDFKGAPAVMGAPVLEPNGKVVGVVVRACKDTSAAGGDGGAAQGCAPVVIAAPVYALRGFLMKTPASAVAPAPWLGLGGAPSEAGNVRGVRVVGVAPGSPAEKAGLKAGDNADIIVAVDGKPVESAEQLAEAIAKHSIGQTVKLLVFSGGAFREAQATLKAAPTP
jgi:serine protease Do